MNFILSLLLRIPGLKKMIFSAQVFVQLSKFGMDGRKLNEKENENYLETLRQQLKHKCPSLPNTVYSTIIIGSQNEDFFKLGGLLHYGLLNLYEYVKKNEHDIEFFELVINTIETRLTLNPPQLDSDKVQIKELMDRMKDLLELSRTEVCRSNKK